MASRIASSDRKTIPENVKSERPRTCCRARLGRGPKLERMRVRSANVAKQRDVSVLCFRVVRSDLLSAKAYIFGSVREA